MELLEEAVQNATRHPGTAPMPAPAPAPQGPTHQSPRSSRAGLDDSEVFCTEPEAKGLPAGTGPQHSLQGECPALLEGPECGGSTDDEGPGRLPPSASPHAENRGGRSRNPIVLPLPGPLCMDGLADAALEDVETLRQLLLGGLLSGHPRGPQASGEPEDDLTPTPSVVGTASHPWNPGSPGRAPARGEGDSTCLPEPKGDQPEAEDEALCSLEHLPPRARSSGRWEPPELDRTPEEEALSTEAAGSYQVVRRAEVAGGQAVPVPPESGPPEPPDVEGGARAAGNEALLGTGRARAECGPTDAPPDRRPRLSALSDVAHGPEAGTGLTRAPCRELHGPLSEQEGNCFYVSVPAGPLDSSTDPSQQDSLSAWQAGPGPQLQGDSGDHRRPSNPTPSLALRDMGVIFRTIEHLTLKLHKLKDMELAHRELLLRSLGGESSGGTTPVGSAHTEAARWTESSLSPATKELLASDCTDSHDLEPRPEPGASTALEDDAAQAATSPRL